MVKHVSNGPAFALRQSELYIFLKEKERFISHLLCDVNGCYFTSKRAEKKNTVLLCLVNIFVLKTSL